MSSQTPQQVVEGQRQDWNRVAGGWEKWDRFFDEQMAFIDEECTKPATLPSSGRASAIVASVLRLVPTT